MLVAANGDHTATVYDLNLREPMLLLAGESSEEGIRDITISRDSRTIVLAHGRTVRFWDSSTGSAAREAIVSSKEIVATEFSPDGTKIAFGGYDNTVTLWDVLTHEKIATAPTQGSVESIRFSPDGSLLACGLRDAIQLFEVSPLTSTHRFVGMMSNVEGLAFSPDGHDLVASCMGGLVRVFNLRVGDSVGDVFESQFGWLSSVSFAPDGNTIYVAGRSDGVRRFHAVPLP